jgi:catechol 2,3-dioxygenase-like lactoylglutathione lyase family enzyme
MAVTLNHTIIHAHDSAASAAFLSEVLGLAPPTTLSHFTVVQVGDTSLDFLETDGDISPRHFAFKVSEDEFEAIFDRLKARRLPYWADPFHKEPGRINRWDDGRGLYFEDPNGHNLEILTRSYGSGGLDAEHPHPLVKP